MAEQQTNNPSADQGLRPPKGGRKPKQGNTELFNEILSAQNALSVSERVRLVKSMAGQLQMVAINSSELPSMGIPQSAKRDAPKAQIEPKVNRVNPLRGTQFEFAKDQAYQALVQAKREAGGEKLAPQHPAVVNYGAALAAYKVEHKRLQPVIGMTSSVPANSGSVKKKARTASTRSPEPGTTRGSTASRLIGGLKSLVKKTNVQDRSNAMEEDDAHL